MQTHTTKIWKKKNNKKTSPGLPYEIYIYIYLWLSLQHLVRGQSIGITQ